MEQRSTGLRRSHILICLGMITLFALMGRMLLGMWYTNRFDTEWYLMWAADLQEGFWNCYDGHVRALDYPPLYLCLLKPVGALLKVPMIAEYIPYRMLLIKFWPIVFDTAIIPMIYLMFRRYNESAALLGACLWAVNPSSIFNCAAWGQTDSIMTLMLMATFWAFYERRPLYGTFLFALSGLMKMQSLYFAPVVLCIFLRQKDWKGLIKALIIGAGTVCAVFLPFMIASNNFSAIFEVYFGGFGKYPYVNLNAFNLWGIWDLNWVKDASPLIGGITYNMVSTFLMLASFAGVMFLHITARHSNVWLHGALLMQCLFILTTRQHERYQYIVMIMLLAAYLTEQNPKLLGLFGGVTFVTFWNQALLLGKNNHGDAPWVHAFTDLQCIGSVINVVLFVITVLVCIRIAYDRRPPKGVSA